MYQQTCHDVFGAIAFCCTTHCIQALCYSTSICLSHTWAASERL